MSLYDPYEVVGDILYFAFEVTVPQFGQIARLSGISFPHRSQVIIDRLSFVSNAPFVIAENHSISSQLSCILTSKEMRIMILLR